MSETLERWEVTVHQFVDEVMRHVPKAATTVWMRLFADYVNDDYGVAWASPQTLADALGMSPRLASAGLRWLTDKGLVTVAHEPTERGGPAGYSVNEHPAQCVPNSGR